MNNISHASMPIDKYLHLEVKNLGGGGGGGGGDSPPPPPPPQRPWIKHCFLYACTHMALYFQHPCQGLFQDFASEGENAKFQNSKGGGGGGNLVLKGWKSQFLGGTNGSQGGGGKSTLK